MCCMRLAGNTGCKNDAKSRHLRTIAQLCRAESSQLRHVSTIRKKNLLSSNICSTCPHNMVNFGPLEAEIASLVWSTPSNFNGFHVLASLLHSTLVLGNVYKLLSKHCECSTLIVYAMVYCIAANLCTCLTDCCSIWRIFCIATWRAQKHRLVDTLQAKQCMSHTSPCPASHFH